MISLLQGIANAISTVLDLVASIIQGIIDLFRYIGIALATLAKIVLLIPGDLQVIALAFIGITTAYLIIGRNG